MSEGAGQHGGDAAAIRGRVKRVDIILARGNAESIIEEVASAVGRWQIHASQADVGRQSMRTISEALEECLALV
jgi:hypothetical protein